MFKNLAHELGHNLGMLHDFTGVYASPKKVLLDSKGQTCTDIGGVMDYYVTVTRWSSCSNEFFYKLYNSEVQKKGNFCLEVYSEPPVGNCIV
jgi:hypothetical protein